MLVGAGAEVVGAGAEVVGAGTEAEFRERLPAAAEEGAGLAVLRDIQ